MCCGPIPHFDLSYWAHEKLAHPIQGKMMLKFRPVSCDTKEPLDARAGAAARLGTRGVSARDGKDHSIILSLLYFHSSC